ncbi:MAG: DUF4169 family protein [Afipia sp.]|nr:DUF4169 family protein [Afipia sp.]
MGDLVNLKRFKKRNERDGATKKAEANRALFGRTRSEKKRDALQKNLAAESVDGHRIDNGAPK